jgi:muramidase (phage lysozyme)
MPLQYTKVYEGFTSAKDADLAGIGLRLEGYTTSVEVKSDGSFTLIATKTVDQASNEVDSVFEESDGGDQGNVIPTSDIKSLLDFIATYESSGNYNAYFGNSRNQNFPKFTSMTLASVRTWQENFVTVNGSRSSAVGRYQIIRSTLDLLIDQLSLDKDNERFTQKVQDMMAKKLLERRGLGAFLQRSISVQQFGNSLAKEWAALPVLTDTVRSGTPIKRGDSFYSGIAGNRALADTDEFEAHLEALIA